MDLLDAFTFDGVSAAIVASLFSIIGALVWLLFWLQEDWRRPEPKGLVALTFIYGGLSTAIALPLQLLFQWLLQEKLGLAGMSVVFLIVISVTEEIVKYGAAYVAALRRKEFDEPVDALIYLITSAVGFTAVENSLYIFKVITSSTNSETVLFGLHRLITPSVLHIVVSALVGFAIALGFYHKKLTQRILLISGLFAAVTLHTLFNYLILKTDTADLLGISVWISAIVIIFLFEYVKRIKPPTP
ncbi:MAG: PrsW family glutamic-type intramembrane protease [bacterium]|nr:PrsW family glutamic-type intramembrane protease [bacterium]